VLDTRGVGNVHGHAERLAPKLAHPRRGRLGQIAVNVRHDHVGARLGQGERHVAPEPATTAGHQCGLATQVEEVQHAHRRQPGRGQSSPLKARRGLSTISC